MANRPLTVAWFSYFPVEWLPGAPECLQRIPRQHPASWQRVLLEEFEKDPELRLHVVVLRKQFERDLTFERNGVTFHLVKTPAGFRAPSGFWVDTILIRRVLRQVQPDVVHAWGTEQGAALVAERLGYARVVTIQGLLSWYGTVTPLSWHDRLARWLERRSLARAPLATTEARFSVQYLRHRYPRLRVEQIEHAPDPVFHRVQRQPRLQPLRLLFVGAFDHRKGGDLLVRALDVLQRETAFDLVVVGKPNPALLPELQAVTSAALWRRISFKEHLTHLEVAQELSAATLLVCPSRADVSPNAVKEAVVAGVPVVASAVGGIPDYVFPGQNGVLCAPGDSTELLTALRAACRHPQFGQGKVDARVLEQTRRYLSPELMGRKFRMAYGRALNGGR